MRVIFILEIMKGKTMKHRPEYDMKLIGKNLRCLRKKKNFSVNDVRKYLCLGSVQAIYKYESGKSYPPADAMLALMELYGASVADVTQEHEAKWYLPSVDLMFPDVTLYDRTRKQQISRLVKYKLNIEIAG